MSVQLKKVTVISEYRIKLDFTSYMKNDENLKNANNYIITPVENGVLVTPQKVSTGNIPHTNFVVVEFTKPTLSEIYAVTTSSNLVPSDGTAYVVIALKFKSRITKFDIVAKQYSTLYDFSLGSNIGAISQAITNEDDLIGGNRDDYLPE